jgi:GAF domain-containing protein
VRHIPASRPDDEPERLRELYALELLDSAPEPAFERIVLLASRLFHAPIALVSLIGAERNWYKACLGLEVREVPRDTAICAHTTLGDQPLVVPDLSLDERFADHP